MFYSMNEQDNKNINIRESNNRKREVVSDNDKFKSQTYDNN